MADETSSTMVPLTLTPSTLTEGDMIATFDVLSEQGHLGGGDDKILIKEGMVSVGRPELYSVADRAAETPLRPVPDPDGRTWTQYLVIFPFTVHPPAGERRYQKVVFKVTLSDPDITASKLMPDCVSHDREVETTYDLGFSIAMSGNVAVVAGEGKGSASYVRSVKFKELKPIITAYCQGENEFYWIYTSIAEKPIEPGGRYVAAILHAPKDGKRLEAVISWKLELERRIFELWEPVVVRVNDYHLKLSLQP